MGTGLKLAHLFNAVKSEVCKRVMGQLKWRAELCEATFATLSAASRSSALQNSPFN